MSESYYCSKCKKEHDMKYNPHKKYWETSPPIAEIIESMKEESDLWENASIHDGEEFMKRFDSVDKALDLEEIKQDIKRIKKILDDWSFTIQRASYHWKRDAEFIKWTGSGLGKGMVDMRRLNA